MACLVDGTSSSSTPVLDVAPAVTVPARSGKWTLCRRRQSARRATGASGFDMDVAVVLFLVALAIWMFAIWRDYNQRHTQHKS
jgi:hypothetical protein